MLNDIKIETLLERNGYKILGQLGYKSNSLTLRVLSVKYDQVFVCKVIKKGTITENTLNTCCNVFHENLSVCFFYIDDSSYYYVFLEECPFGNIKEYVKKNGPIQGQQIIEFAKQIVAAAKYLHENKIFQLNINLSNVLISWEGRIKLSGVGQNEKGTSNLDSDSFMCVAPEILRGEKYDPIKADSWSIGVICYFMLTGEMPWDITQNANTTVFEMAKGEYNKNIKGDQIILKIINHTLIPDPNQRVTASQIAKKLETIIPANSAQCCAPKNLLESGQRTHVNCTSTTRVMSRRKTYSGHTCIPVVISTSKPTIVAPIKKTSQK